MLSTPKEARATSRAISLHTEIVGILEQYKRLIQNAKNALYQQTLTSPTGAVSSKRAFLAMIGNSIRGKHDESVIEICRYLCDPQRVTKDIKSCGDDARMNFNELLARVDQTVDEQQKADRLNDLQEYLDSIACIATHFDLEE